MWPVADILQEKTEICRSEAKLPGTPAAAFIALLALAVICALLLNLAGRAPYGAFLELAVLALTAAAVYAVLKKGTFAVTYVLTADGMLVYLTRYGFLSRETAHIDLSRAEIKGNKIIYGNKSYDFYPDANFLKLLREKIKLQHGGD